MDITIIAVPSGFQAAVFNHTGTIDFWTDTGSWHRVGTSAYPYATGTTPPSVTVQAAVLGASLNAMYVVDNPAYAAAGSHILYATGANGWGIVTAKNPSRLVSCGCGTRQIGPNSPGFPRDLNITFSGNDVVITSAWVTTENGVRNTASYPLVTDWEWTGSDFTTDGGNIFTAKHSGGPGVGTAPLPLTGHRNGKWTAIVTKITGTDGPPSSPLQFTLVPGQPKTPSGPTVVVDVAKDTTMILPVAGGPSTLGQTYVTAPAWMSTFINPTRSGQAAFTRLSTEGDTPYYVPPSLHLDSSAGLVRFIRTKHEVLTITFTHGAVTLIGVQSPD
jgi:hypothetical protein